MFGTTSRRILGLFACLATFGTAQLVIAPSAQADADPDPYCYTTPSTKAPEYNGPSASRVYDWVNPGAQTKRRFSPNVNIPAGLLEDHYVPQGLATWKSWNGKGEDILLISAYHDQNGNKTPDGHSAVFGVVVNGPRAGTGLGRMLIKNGHVGGLAVYGKWLYVGSEFAIRRYRLTTVRNELVGRNRTKVVPAVHFQPTSYRVGFMGTGDGHVWAGAFETSKSTHLNGYVQTSSGDLRYQKATQAYAPKKTQGVTVTKSHVIFSTSYKRGERGNIWIFRRGQHKATDANSYCFRAPSMNQGVTVLRGRLYLGFESGAYTYNHDPSKKPRNRIVRVHSAVLTDVTSLFTGGPAD